MNKNAIDLILKVALLGAVALLILLWHGSSDNGRYQVRAAEVSVRHFQGRLAVPSKPEQRLYRVDTRSGKVWELEQTLYQDTGFVTYLGYWMPVDTMFRYKEPDSQPRSPE